MTGEVSLRYALAECECHVWVVNRYERLGRCGRCNETPAIRPGPVPEGATMICKHEGECRRLT